MKTHRNVWFIIIYLLAFTGCASLLPSSKVTVISPWKDYESTKANYAKIAPGETTLENLRGLGFDPFAVPNIRILTATEVINMYMPNPSIRIEDLDPGIQECVHSRVRCTGYQIVPSILHADRVGNFWLDFFTFTRRTVNTGWEFRGVIILVDNVVTYKDPPGGRPVINTEQVDVRPLGPLQDLGGIITTELRRLF
jgi:hypothetical protein